MRRVLALQVALNSFILLIASFLIGTHILHFFGISIPVVQVGGGLIVISNGWTMLKSKEEGDRGPEVQKEVNPTMFSAAPSTRSHCRSQLDQVPSPWPSRSAPTSLIISAQTSSRFSQRLSVQRSSR